MAERSEAPRDAARRIVEQVLAERGEQVLAERGEQVLAERGEQVLAERGGSGAPSADRAGDAGSREVVEAPPTDLEPADAVAAAAADDPDDPRARARALVAEVLAARAALDESSVPEVAPQSRAAERSASPPSASSAGTPDAPPASAGTPDAPPASAGTPDAPPASAGTPDAPPASAGAVVAPSADTDPSRVRARELVAAALADAERRAAEADAERAAAEAERERAATERARREAERERRIAAERRAVERRAAADDGDPGEGADAGSGEDDAEGPPRPPDETAAEQQPDPGTTMPMSVAELAASVGASGTDVAADETHALPRHRDEPEEPATGAPEPTGGWDDQESVGATVALPVQRQEPAATEDGPPAGEDPHVATDTAVVGEMPSDDTPVVEDLWPEENGPHEDDRAAEPSTPEDAGDDASRTGVPAGGALEASVEVEDRPRQRRTGRWLLTSLLGAIALAVLFPLAVDALRALVAL